MREIPYSNTVGKTILSVRTAAEFMVAQSFVHSIRKSEVIPISVDKYTIR